MRHSISILIGLLFSLVMTAQSTESDTKEQNDPRFYASIGIGIDHQVLGTKFIYHVSDQFSVNASIGLLLLLSESPSFGLEYYFLDQTQEKRLSPFVLAQIGRPINYTVYTEEIDLLGFSRESDRKYVSGVTLGAGISYFLPKKQSSLTLSLHYTADLNPSRLTDFVLDFIEERSLSENIGGNSSFRKVFISIGYKFSLRSLFHPRA